MTAQELHMEFRSEYPYISVSLSACEDFLAMPYISKITSTRVLLEDFKDFVLSQGMEDEIEL